MILFNFFTRGFEALPVGILFSPVFSAPVSGQHAVLTPSSVRTHWSCSCRFDQTLMAATYFEDQSV